MTHAFKSVRTPVGMLRLVASNTALAAVLWENDDPKRVRLSPLVDIASIGGNASLHFGAAATVGVGRHIDVGVAEVQRPGSTGFTRVATTAVVGVHL